MFPDLRSDFETYSIDFESYGVEFYIYGVVFETYGIISRGWHLGEPAKVEWD